MSNNLILLVMTALVLKHFFADFPLQNLYMLGKGKKSFAWILPLTAHCGVHALFTFIIFWLYNPRTAWVAVVDFAIHFVVDRVKATYRMPEGVWSPQERGRYLKKFYMAFGLDQLAHSLTYVALIYIALGGI